MKTLDYILTLSKAIKDSLSPLKLCCFLFLQNGISKLFKKRLSCGKWLTFSGYLIRALPVTPS